MAGWLILGVLVVGGYFMWRAGWFEKLEDFYEEYVDDDEDEEDE